jgi:hypothetical protein
MAVSHYVAQCMQIITRYYLFVLIQEVAGTGKNAFNSLHYLEDWGCKHAAINLQHNECLMDMLHMGGDDHGTCNSSLRSRA